MTKPHLPNITGTELPVIQAPMAGVQDSALAIAVSQAGGLGSLPCAMLNAQTLRAELARIRSQTDRPFNVNCFCHSTPPPNEAREAAWRALLSPYFEAFGIDPGTIVSGAGRAPFSADTAAIMEEFRPPVVSFHFGLPQPALLEKVKSWGATVISSATTVEEALWLEAHGADGIIAQGLEAGGHRGHFLAADIQQQMGTFALLPQVVAAVRVPVIAAGGIVDRQGVVAALALGASAVQVGTAYLLCPEATTSAVHRAILRSDAARHTALTNLFSGGIARGIVNRLMRELGPLNPAAPDFPRASGALAPLRAAAEAQHSGDFSPLWAGQNTSACRAIAAAALTRELGGAD
ncbi:NAD(P)H-dependent flavin oxidoreductase [Parahaliea aestuarii]|uniref:Nitronate monooxygenase n=1 Tax=Parahaliea aestuarii TaxID=1852021 RepID=A0A5C9A019_9GAMM|nr:nitronate monooxygenase [Parahaliea aestuarii]TXS93232.1 nitronate monooxygenase [Parahaliea aestuarii]